MEQSLSNLTGFITRATDGDLGHVNEFFFDDEMWTIRYMVADTGNWLADRKVLISPVALCTPDWESKTFPVNLTCDQVRNSPDIDTKRPVHRQHEIALMKYYQWPHYWEGGFGGTFGITPYPLLDEPITDDPVVDKQKDDEHLRSTHQVTGYFVHATDGEVGHVKDFIVDDVTWEIKFLVVDVSSWFFGKKVLVSPQWIKRVTWSDSSVYLDAPRGSVKNCREYIPEDFNAVAHSEILV
jgi:hypothetical protein